MAADERLAFHLIDLMTSHRWDDFAPYFDARMKQAVPPAKLRRGWIQVTSDLGGYRSHGQPTTRTDRIYEVIEIPLELAHGTAIMRASFAPSGRVAGLYLLPQDES